MKRVAAIATALAAVLAVPRADAFCRRTTCNDKSLPCTLDDAGCPSNGTPVSWKRPMPLEFRFQRRGTAFLVDEEARAAVRAAFYRWTDVTCADGRRTSLRFIEGEELVEDKPLVRDAPRPTPFGIYFRDYGWAHGSNGDTHLAITNLEFGTESGRIAYADIEINTAAQAFSTRDADTGFDLQTTLTHEVGHYIGLAHSLVPNSIMASSLCDSGDRCTRDHVSSRRLGDDDRAAVCALYPPADPAPAPAASSSSSCAVAPKGRDGSAIAGAFVAALIAARGIRRARRTADDQ